LEKRKEKKKGLLQISSGCVKEVKLGAHGRQLKSRAIEKDGIKIRISKREDITSVGIVCITDYDSWPSDQTHTEEGSRPFYTESSFTGGPPRQRRHVHRPTT
jgi:hypothetical protein